MGLPTTSAICLAVLSIPSPAEAGYCSQPTAPSAYISKPSKPFCAPRCSEWEVQTYRDELDRYFRRLKQYAQEVDDYYREAGEYVDCMAKLD